MNIKRAFLAAVAVLMLPGAVMAQSTVFFDVGVNYVGLNGQESEGLLVEATLTCNTGIPLEQTAMVGTEGADERVMFTVTEFVPGTCNVTFGPVPYEGWDYNPDQDLDAVCSDLVGGERCTAEIIPATLEYSVDVAWEFTDDADMSLADDAMVAIMCSGDTNSSTTVDASPDSDALPYVMDVMPESSCEAYLMNVGSAIVSDDSDCDVDFEYGDSSDVACVITAGVFFEGIPTLSQYGMAIMALLMLAVGFVGFRRFV